MSDQGGQWDIYTVQPDGTGLRRITNGAGRNSWDPAWSWDGRLLAWSVDDPSGANIIIANGDGTNVHSVTPDDLDNTNPSFSPDGTRIVYTVAWSEEMRVIPTEGGTTQTIGTGSFTDWSPDGGRIVYALWGPANTGEMYILNLSDLSTSRIFDPHPGYRDIWPTWSPDGSKIAFNSDRTGELDIWVMNADKTGLQNLTPEPQFTGERPTWSPDGQYIAFSSQWRICILRSDGSPLSDGSHVWVVPNTPWRAWRPTWPKRFGAVNRPPVAAGDVYSTDEDTLLGIAAPGVLENDTDPDNDPLTAVLVGGTTNGSVVLDPDGSFSYLPNPNFNGNDQFTYKANDGQLDSNVATVSITVNPVNDAPTLGEIVVSADLLAVNTQVNATAAFADVDVGDTHAASWDWGDGSQSAGTVDEANNSVTGSHAYSAAGVYTVTLTLTDSAGAFAQAVYRYIVVYDPSAGFVTGGGWIDSPPGAYTPDPTLTGKANFGFVSKYQKGATVPTGQTEFNFHAAGMNFHSTSYQWLVVAGPHAKYKGSGTINGSGDYGFMLTATDGQVSGGGDVDRFWIRIWDKATDAIVYDNQMGDADDAAATDAIEGGSIVIHQAK